MFRYTSYRNTFIIAALVILLCIGCLTGATLAIFTATTEPGTIAVITTAGDIKIDIVDPDDGVTSLAGEKLKFMITPDTPQEDTLILFEPGATFYTQGFKVKNDGTIPVNFKIAIDRKNIKCTDKENPVEFTDAFDIWITTNPSGPLPEDMEKPYSGRIDAEDISATYYLVIRMKETAGNDFQGKKFAQIGFTVTATQGNVNP